MLTIGLLLAACAAVPPVPAIATLPITVPAPRAVDDQPPVLTFLAPLGSQFAYGPLEFSIEASDNAALASLTLSSDDGREVAWTFPAGTTLATREHAFTGLWPGTHVLTAQAIDATGNRRSATRTVSILPATIDREAPRIELTAPLADPLTVLEGSAIRISGRVFDDTRLSALEWRLTGATSASGTMAPESTWATTLPAIRAGASTLTITARSGGKSGTRVLAITATAAPGGGGGGGGSAPAEQSTSGSCGVGSGVASLLLAFASLLRLRFRRIE